MQWLFRFSVLRILLLAAVVLFFLFSPYDLRRMVSNRRDTVTSVASTPLEIAIVWPKENGHHFVEGALLAVRQINSRGGIAIADEKGALVKTTIHVAGIYDEAEPDRVVTAASRIARNPNLTAVIGYSQPDLAIRAAVTYQDFGVLYVSPSVSDDQLTLHGFWSTIRTIPEDAVMSESTVKAALAVGCRSAAILYVRNSYGATFERLWREGFGKFSVEEGTGTNRVNLKLAYEGYYSEDQRSFYQLISDLLDQKFDVVFLGDSLLGDSAPRTMEVIRQLREMGVQQPIMGSEELHSLTLWDVLKDKANHTYAPNIFNLHDAGVNEEVRRFYEGFVALYGTRPSMHAGEAYEAVELVAQAAERAKSKNPIKLSIMFKSTTKWDGLQGKGQYDFSNAGGIEGKRVVVEELVDGEFVAPQTIGSTVVTTNRLMQTKRKHRK